MIKGRDERIISWKKMAATFLITVVIFSLGLLVGAAITADKVDDILSFEKEARLQLESFELEEKLLESTPCVNPSLLSSELEELGVRLAYLETQYAKDDPRILELKKPYTLLELRHYLKMKDMLEQCENEDYTTILFFYSNKDKYLDVSEKQGFVLGYLQKKYTTEKIKVYSFDADLDLDIVQTLMRVYGVKQVPSVIIGDKLYVGFHEKEEFEEIIESKIQ